MPSDADFTNDFFQYDGIELPPPAPAPLTVMSLPDASELLDEIVQVAEGADDPVTELAKLLQRLVPTIQQADWNDCDQSECNSDSVTQAVIDGANAIRESFAQDADAMQRVAQLHDDILSRFADHLTQDDDLEDALWSDADEIAADQFGTDNLAPDQPTAEEIEALLSTLQGAEAKTESSFEPAEVVPTAKQESCANIDVELRLAFLDDADRCMAAMENALLSLESNPADLEPLGALGRELHTLKGASGSIGLCSLAEYIHSVEDSISELETKNEPADMETLLQHVDTIRGKVNDFRGNDSTPPASPPHPQGETSTAAATVQQPPPKPIQFDEDVVDEESVRVKSSKLNRLMDMLSELVMLRNQRDTELSRLIAIHEALIENVGRLRVLQHENEAPSLASSDPKCDPLARVDSGKMLHEIANDILESAQHLRECYQPVADGNNQVSQFIRGFRQELVGLRRSPIAGIFLRLRRAVSDAARADNKQATLELCGEETGIERSLQSRIFEPLLHIVRNAVSHGIESPAQRIACGKPEQGTITLRAESGPDLLVIEVRDDGGGLDFEAIRRRGLERGLITADVSNQTELAQLIFHPGFSTRQTADQISGRGVGMDVVAATLQRLRGWVDVDSVAGQGTKIRLSLPLPSMIQHVMMFRAGGQSFAVPMQAVQNAGDPDQRLNPVCIRQLLGLDTASSAAANEDSKREMMVLRTQTAGGTDTSIQSRSTAILVDEIIGPEEVVVRPMPRLFKQHPVCSGATLSGLGEIVLLLDANRLAQASPASITHNVSTDMTFRRTTRVLVVDDSASARTRTVQSLRRYDAQIVQLADGQEAWNALQVESFDAVFSDIDMPHMNGLQLLAQIKQNARSGETPVVLISSRTEKSIHDLAAQLGAVACLPKPLTDSALDNVISDMPLNLSKTN